MLVEHTFVTTREMDDALYVAREYLVSLGYRGGAAEIEPSPTGGFELTMKRGGSKINAAVSMADLPQSATVHFDRGRVVVAASIHEHRKVDHLHRKLTLAVATGLEQVMVYNAAFDDARVEFDATNRQMAAEFDKRKRRRVRAVGCLVTFIVGVIALAIWAASRQ